MHELPRPSAQSRVGDQQLPICANCFRAKRYCDHRKDIKFRHHDPAADVEEDLPDPIDPLISLKHPDIAHLFQHYCKVLAPWYDLSDSHAQFLKYIPYEALFRPLLFKAIIAFAAVHLSCTGKPSIRSTAERHHTDCVRLLIDLNQDDVYPEDGIILASVCLLRSYEILAEDFDPNRHLSGAYALATGGSPDIGKPSLWRAGFFNYLREDITFSLINRCPLKIDLSSIAIPDVAVDDEDQLNVAALYLASAINLVFDGDGSGTYTISKTQGFWRWRASLPTQFTPYIEEPSGEVLHTLPSIRMLRDCHVAVLQYCLVTVSVLQSTQTYPETIGGPLHDNAARICGLAFTADSPAVVVNSFGPLSFSCRYLKHRALQADLIARLLACRRETGWPVQRIVDDLERHWRSEEDTDSESSQI